MRVNLKHIQLKLLELLKLSPLSLAEKCRVAFGAAVIFILALALLLPYIWMGQLVKKASLDAGRAKAEMLLTRHFQMRDISDTPLAPLDNSGAVADANNQEIWWVRLKKENENQLQQLTSEQREKIDSLIAENTRTDSLVLEKKDGVLHSNYTRIFRATDTCISCHNPQGSAGAFSQNEPIGALLVSSGRTGSELSRIALLNRVWIIIAGLIAGTGAIVAFYIITQRVILSPIRQLRALATNVTDGNLDIRSSIKTGDEYEKLANAFNNMLDGLQVSQEKLRQANRQLDAKIAELSERNIELFKANKIKSEFLANMSHEFRTPLNAILGFAEILRENPSGLNDAKQKRYAENIITGGKRLLNMINDLLDLAKTEAGKMKLHIETTSVQTLCKQLILSFSLLAKNKKIKIKLTLDNTIPELTTDAGKVQQILSNFLSNAIKFTPEYGRIEIQAIMLDEKHIRLSVSDTGCGIAESDREKIFEKFRQVDGSITRESTGSGLGLAICKELAALIAGNISLESEPGNGSKFRLDMPINLSGDETKPE